MEKIFKEFSTSSFYDWWLKAQKDLKGTNPIEKLSRQITDGIFQSPYYDDGVGKYKSLNISGLMHERKFDKWFNLSIIQVLEETEANRKALNALKSGSNGLLFRAEKRDCDLQKLLKNIDTRYCHLSFDGFETRELTSFFFKGKRDLDIDHLGISTLSFDPDYQLSRDIGTFSNEIMETLDSEGFHSLAIPLDKGESRHLTADIAEKLSFFVDIYVHSKISDISKLFNKVILVNHCFDHFFLEISKLRSLRVLFSELATSLGLERQKIFINSVTTVTEDSERNLLSNSSQAMAAILGGTDAIVILPHQSDGSDFSSRIARNVSNLLCEESHLDKVTDPLAGSYYVDTLTRMLVKESWEKFCEIEENGGYSKISKA